MNAYNLNIIVWNCNGLSKHVAELKTFLQIKSVDVMLLSETHTTNKTYVKIPNYNVFHTTHPANKAHGGTAIIIRQNIKYLASESYQKEHIQATSITIEDSHGKLMLCAIYCPPRFNNTKTEYLEFLKTQGHRFIIGGDYNAKNQIWGSRITNAKGKNLHDAILEYKSKFISTGEPTYWPSDTAKTPDLIDFFITKNIDHKCLTAKSCFDLSSDHSPIILNFESTPNIMPTVNYHLYNKKTCWDTFCELINRNIDLHQSLKNDIEIDMAIANFNDVIVNSVRSSTPEFKTTVDTNKISNRILNKIREKRKLRKTWQESRSPVVKAKLNKVTKELKEVLKSEREMKLQSKLSQITATKATNYSLWKITKTVTNSIIHEAPIKLTNGMYTKTNAEKAKAFACYFQQ